MKNILIFLILISLVFCIDEARREEMRQRRQMEMKYLADCLLKNERISE